MPQPMINVVAECYSDILEKRTNTTAINLGGALPQKGYKVLLIDLDGQANLTESLGFSAELPQTIYGAMKGEYDLPIYEHKDGLSVVPSCLDLSAVETELINEAGRELILAHLIKGQKEKFDYILIDCPPSLSLLCRATIWPRVSRGWLEMFPMALTRAAALRMVKCRPLAMAR